MRGRGIGRRGPGLVGTMATTAVVVGTAHAVGGAMSGNKAEKQQQASDAAAYQQQQEMAQQQAMAEQAAANVAAQQAAAAPPPPAAPAAPAEDPTIAKLKELSELNKQGILSDEEFASAKAKLLA